MDLQQLNTAFQNYLQSDKSYFLFLTEIETIKHIGIYPQTVENAGRSVGLVRLKIDQALKRYISTLQPSKLTPTGRVLDVRPLKSDIAIDPFQIWHTYLGERMKTSKQSTREERLQGFPNYLSAFVQNIIREEMEEALWLGLEDPSKDDTLSLFNGLHTQIANAIVETDPQKKISERNVLGAYIENSVERIEMLFDFLPEKLKNKPLKVFISPEMYLDYVRAYRKDYTAIGGLDRTQPQIIKTIDGTLAEFAVVSGLANSQRIVITPSENVKAIVPEVFEMPSQVQGRELLFLPKFDAGINFIVPELIFTTKDNLFNPSSGVENITNTGFEVVFDKIPNAISYKVEVANDTLFSSIASTQNVNDNDSEDYTAVFSGLNANTEYSVRVTAIRGNDKSVEITPSLVQTLA